MENKFSELIKYIKQIGEFTLPDYKDIPTIPLYMEQVTSYISETLSPFYRKDKNSIITPYMVNNYVKAKIIIPPVEKKYNRDHLGYLMFISLLKTSANMRDLATFIELDKEFTENKEEVYKLFKDLQESEIKKVTKEVLTKVNLIEESLNNETDEDKATLNEYFNLANLALRLYIASETRKIIADAIMQDLNKIILPSKALEGENIIEQKLEEKKIRKEAEKLSIRK